MEFTLDKGRRVTHSRQFGQAPKQISLAFEVTGTICLFAADLVFFSFHGFLLLLKQIIVTSLLTVQQACHTLTQNKLDKSLFERLSRQN